MVTINGEKVIRYHIHGEYQGDLCFDNLTTLKDTYNKLKETKEFDRSHYIEDNYWIECETDTTMYGDYTIRKYKNRYTLVNLQ
jgi:hypothetical protein